MNILRSIIILILLPYCLMGQEFLAQQEKDNERIAQIRKGKIRIFAMPGETVTVIQRSHEFSFGAALSNSFVGSMSADDKKQYEEKFLQNFNSAVTENALKWHSMEREKGNTDYRVVEGLLAWCEANGIPLRGHNIYWGIPKFVQDWVKELDDESLELTLRLRALDVATRYRGRFAEYDLNNEMIHGNFYEDRLGEDITKKMVWWTRQGDPEAKLYLNDYDVLTGNRLDDYLAQIRSLVAQGVRLDGIGAQGHLHSETFDRHELRRSLDSLASFGLPIKVTEFNMPGQRSAYHRENIAGLTPEHEVLMASELEDYYRICFAHPAVEGILMWGFWAGANWIPASSLYNRDWTPTALAHAYRNLVFSEWWTEETVQIGKEGTVEVSAFYGDYDIRVGDRSLTTTLEKAKGSTVVNFLP